MKPKTNEIGLRHTLKYEIKSYQCSTILCQQYDISICLLWNRGLESEAYKVFDMVKRLRG